MVPRERTKTPIAPGRARESSDGESPEVEGVPSLDEIESRLALDDHTGALELARTRLAARPTERASLAYVRRCEETLTEMYASHIGDFGRRLSVSMRGSELQWLSIDHRAGFLVAQIDGTITVEDLLEICGMARLDALRILHDLLQQKVISLESDGRGR